MTASPWRTGWQSCSTPWWWSAVLLLVVSCYCTQKASAQTTLIVRLEAPASGKVGADRLRRSFAEQRRADPRLSVRFERIQRTETLAWEGGEAFVVELPDSLEAEALRAELARLDGVRYVQYNHTYRLDGARHFGGSGLLAAAAPFDSLEHLLAIGIPEAWAVSRGRETVRVGVVDSGLWLEHPAFAGQLAINAAEDVNGNGRFDEGDLDGIDADGNGYVDDVVGYDFVDRGLVLFDGDYRVRDPDPSDDPAAGPGRGHGTSVAGVLAARSTGPATAQGAAPGIRLVPLRAFGADGVGEDDDVVAAILYGVALGVDVLNLSFGDVYHSPLMQDAIDYAVSQGVVVVASAGNDGRAEPHYPSDYPGVISVAWLTQDGRSRSGRAARGVGVDLGAPGSQIYTTLFRPGDESVLYGRQSGSSVAAPQVSAAAALLRSVRPDLSPGAIRDVLVATAQDIEEPGWDEGTGAGLLRVDRAPPLALPARVEVHAPRMDEGVASDDVPVVATALDPSFDRLFVEVAPGTEEPFEWQPLGPARTRPALRDTVATWAAGAFDEGTYTLRVRVERRDGRHVEDRVRVTVDRTPPRFALASLEVGLVDGAWGVLADVETDDATYAWLELPATPALPSDRLARRHGLAWRDDSRAGGDVTLRLRVQNGAGLRRDTLVTRTIPPWQPDPTAFAHAPLDVRAGYQLPLLTDFDGDGRAEIVLNELRDGGVGDTLGFWEWSLTGFARAHALVATVLPRDAGDTDGDGRGELLTQVQRATLVLEAPTPGAFPGRLLFADTTGLGTAPDVQTLSGAVFADLDADGAGELIGHNGRGVRVLERRGATFAETARMPLPDTTRTLAEPDFRVHDLDGNGRPEVIAVDTQGGVWAFEALGDDRYGLAWHLELGASTPRSVLAVGDVTGDGAPELLVFTTNAPGTRPDREQEAPFGTLHLVEFAGGQPTHRAAVRVRAPGSVYASVATAQLDGTGGREVILSVAPNLYVLTWESGTPRVRYHVGDSGVARPTVVRSSAFTVGDVDGDGREEVYASFSDERVHRLWQEQRPLPPPDWQDAYALDDSTLFFRWHAFADSVEMLIDLPDGTVRLATVRDSLRFATREPVRVALRAVRAGERSALSAVRFVRPHAPGRIVSVERPRADVMEVTADVPIGSVAQGGGRVGAWASVSAVQTGAYSVRYQFAGPLEDGAAWYVEGVRDTTGAPVLGRALRVPPLATPEALLVERVEVVDVRTVRLTFTEALASETVIATNFSLSPAGTVERAEWSASQPREVVVRTSGVNLGPTGLHVVLRIANVQSAAGRSLDPDGGEVLLDQSASTLAGAFVFPNPLRTEAHAYLSIGGLTEQAEVLILTPNGVRVRRLESDQTRGGMRWDLLDEHGAPVPSGMYLVRVSAPGLSPRLLRAAVIR